MIEPRNRRRENGPSMDNRLIGKTARVTGGSRGIGKAIAQALYGAGARVIIAGRDPKSLIRAAKEIGEIICVPVDLRKDARELFRYVDRLDILVNNAGGMEAVAKFKTPGPAARNS